MMKRIFVILWVVFVCVAINAQHEPLFIFDKFMNAKIHFNNHTVTRASMNYDAVNDKMFYKDKEDLFELTNAAIIDSIVWPNVRTFIPCELGYLEQVQLVNGVVFIRWRIKNVNVGSRGALGAVTQGKVETISVRSMGVFSATDADSHSADVYKHKNLNEYYVPYKRKLKKVRTLKQVIKLYPEHEGVIREFVKKEKIDMKEPLSVLALLDYCMGLGE